MLVVYLVFYFLFKQSVTIIPYSINHLLAMLVGVLTFWLILRVLYVIILVIFILFRLYYLKRSLLDTWEIQSTINNDYEFTLWQNIFNWINLSSFTILFTLLSFRNSTRGGYAIQLFSAPLVLTYLLLFFIGVPRRLLSY